MLCNGINWTKKKKNIYHTSRIKFHMKGRQRINITFESLQDKNSVSPLAPVA